MFKTKILFIFFMAFLSFSSNAVVLEEVVAEKGYILSIDLYEKECKEIWSKQVPLFMDTNSSVKNPDLIYIGQKILVQNCKKEILEATHEKKEKDSVNKSKKSKKNYKNFISFNLLAHHISKKGGDKRKTGSGYELEFGRRISLDNGKILKPSISLIETQTKYDLLPNYEVNMRRGFLLLNASYLSGEKFKIGPIASVLYSFAGSYNDTSYDDSDEIHGLLGVETEYELHKQMSFDFKLQNFVEGRLNLIGTLGLAFRF